MENNITNEPNQPQVQTQSEVLHTPTPNEVRESGERDAFIRMVQESGDEIPQNFDSAGTWYDSLKEAQKMYTQGQQEISDLKNTYNENGVENPNYQPDTTPTEVVEETVPEGEAPEVSALRVEEAPPEDVTVSDTVPESVQENVSTSEWNDWGNIIDANNGEVPEPLRNAIKMRLNVDDTIINDYIAQRNQVQQQHVQLAADTVGGQEELNKVMDWAGRNLSEQERSAVNSQLTGPGYKTAIMGLKARYDAESIGGLRNQEPNKTPNRQQMGDAVTSVTPYTSQTEMFADQRNPRYRTDAKYRHAVEQRIIATNTYGYRS